MKIIVFFFMVALWCSQSYSQCDSLAVREVFGKSKNVYLTKDSYKVKSTYKAYVDSVAPLQTLTGIMLKNGNYVYSKMDNTERIQQGDKELVISHSERLVKYQEGVSIGGLSGAMDITKLLPLFDRYSVTTTKKGYECEFIAPDINSLPFDKVVIKFRKDYSIESQEMITITKPFSLINGTSGKKEKETKLQLLFSELEALQASDSQPSLQSFIVKKNNQLALKGACSNYQIINL